MRCRPLPRARISWQSAQWQQPGCAILDLRMGGISGHAGLRQLLRARSSPLVVIFLSGHGDIPNAVQAVQNGAFGWIEKPCTPQAAGADRQGAGAGTIARWQQRSASDARLRWQRLTAREAQVAPLVAQGLANKVIARELVPPCGHRAVETYRAHIFAKLQLANSHELYRFMQDNGLPHAAAGTQRPAQPGSSANER